jgi:Na+/H+-dicarboxylate symporter
MEALEKFGTPKPVNTLLLPLRYSCKLDGLHLMMMSSTPTLG